MGRWSWDIMGGDTPLDIQCEIYDVCNIEQYPDIEDDAEEVDLLTKEILESNVDKIISEICEKDLEGYLILGYMMMERGCKMSSDLKTKILQVCDIDEDLDIPERLKVITEFKDILESYDNQAVTLESKGLLEAIFEHIEEGKSGLVNKFSNK